MVYILDNTVVASIFGSLFLLLFFFLLRTDVSADVAHGRHFCCVSLLISIGFGHVGLFDWVSVPLSAALLVFVLMRFGLLALIVAFSVALTLR